MSMLGLDVWAGLKGKWKRFALTVFNAGCGGKV